MIKRSICKRLFLVILLLTGMLMPAAARFHGEAPLLPRITLSDAEAQKHGWMRKSFVFAADAIDFQTFVPAGATVKTAPLSKATKSARERELGNLHIVGKIRLAEADAPVEATLVAIRLSYAASAEQVCLWLLAEAGYRLLKHRAVKPIVEAQTFGAKGEEGAETEGAYTACFTRRNMVLASITMFDLRGAEDVEERNRILHVARTFAGVFVSNMTFDDGKLSALASDQIEALELQAGADRLPVSFPRSMNVVLNDFRDQKLPAELHLARRDRDGSILSHLLFIIGGGAKGLTEQEFDPAAEEYARLYVKTQVSSQSGDAIPKLLAKTSLPAFEASGIKARTYRYSVESGDEKTKGKPELMLTLIVHQRRIYLVQLLSARANAVKRNVFFSLLPGYTAFDMITESLRRHLSDSGD